jgi:hypothetical protein
MLIIPATLLLHITRRGVVQLTRCAFNWLVGSATVLLLQAYFSSGSALLVFSSTTTCLPTTDMSSIWLPLVAASSYGDSAGAGASLLPLLHRLLPPLLLVLVPLWVWAKAASRSAEHSMSSSSSRMAHLRTVGKLCWQKQASHMTGITCM